MSNVLTQLMMKAVLDKVEHGIIVCDEQGNFIFWNLYAQIKLGVNEGFSTRSVWKSYFKVKRMDGSDYPFEEIPLRVALSKDQYIKNERMYVENSPAGKSLYIESDAFPIKDENDKTVGAAVSFTDISPQVKLEQLVDEVRSVIAHIKEKVEGSINDYRKEKQIKNSIRANA